jgi:hypothetical protein
MSEAGCLKDGIFQNLGVEGSLNVNTDSNINHSLKSRHRYYLEEFFTQRPVINVDLNSATEATRVVANRNFEVEGTNMASSNCTFDTERGGVKIQTAGVDQDQAIIIPHTDTNQTAWNNIKWYPNKQTEWECSLTTGSSIDNIKIWAGLKLTSDQLLATDDDQAYFKFQTDSDNSEVFTTFANLHFVYSVGGTDYISDLGIAVTANTTYHLRIKIVKIDSDYKASVFVNGTQYSLTSTAGSTGGTTTGIGTTKGLALTAAAALKPYIGVEAGDAAQKDIIAHYQAINRLV